LAKPKKTEIKPEIVLGNPRCRHSYKVAYHDVSLTRRVAYLECSRCGKTQA